jgi:hypothetical protein
LIAVLILLLLAVHLAAVNVASCGPLVAAWLGWGIRDRDDRLRRWSQSVAWMSIWAFLVGLLCGGAMLLAPYAEGLDAALARLPARAYWFAGVELLFSLLCMLGYAATRSRLPGQRWWQVVLVLLASSNLLYHFPPLMSVLGRLVGDPTWAIEPMLERPVLLELMQREEVLAMSVHFALASFAVAAIAALWQLARSGESEFDLSEKRGARQLAGIALASTVLQLPVGLWLLSSMGHASRGALMGTDALASFAFVGGLLLTLYLLQRLLAIVLGSTERHELRRVAWIAAALILMMTATLRGTL